MNLQSKIVFYLRLSHEDDDLGTMGKEQSNSIGNQEKLLNDFVSKDEKLKKLPITVLKDDGYSGATTDRPQFQKMLEMAKNKEFDILLVKDFSRFARDHIVTFSYIESIFPFLGIRFISVTDNYDMEGEVGKTIRMDIGLQSIAHSYYCHDISVKVRTARLQKAREGKVLTGTPPIGYCKDPKDKNKYLIEPVGAEIVRQIFELGCEGKNTSEITRYLNDKNIPSKGMIKKKELGLEYKGRGDTYSWSPNDVYAILQDEQYLGKMVYGKTRKESVKSEKRIKIPRSEWIIVENAFEPLVSPEIFYEANSKMKRKAKSVRHYETYLFTKRIKCGYCGANLQRNHIKSASYYCRKALEKTNSTCFRKSISEETLSQTILEMIQYHIRNFGDLSVLCEKTENERKSSKTNLHLYEKARQNILEKKDKIFHLLLEDKIDSEEYTVEKMKLEEQQKEWEESIAKEKNKQEKEQQSQLQELPISAMVKDLDATELTREMVVTYIKMIHIYSTTEVEIQWNFSPPEQDL